MTFWPGMASAADLLKLAVATPKQDLWCTSSTLMQSKGGELLYG
jgi:hypothetical protein